MPLEILRVALQGLNAPLSPIMVAVQGLLEEIEQGLWPIKQPDSGGSRSAKRKNQRHRRAIESDDEAVLMAIVAAVTGGHLA